MIRFVETIVDTIDTFVAWLSSSLKQTTESYCDLETADSPTVLVAHDGALISVIRIEGAKALIGESEFNKLHEGLTLGMHTGLARPGREVQVVFNYEKQGVQEKIAKIFEPAYNTAKRLNLNLDDLFNERLRYLTRFCADEAVYLVLRTCPGFLTKEQLEASRKSSDKFIRENNFPQNKRSQNLLAPIAELRDPHDSFVRSLLHDLNSLELQAEILEVHDAIFAMRMIADPDFTDPKWRAALPGDRVPLKSYQNVKPDVSDLFWPSLARQVLPRDAEVLDLRTVRVGDKIYSCVYIDLFPKDLKNFNQLFQRTVATRIPWRISFLINSDGLQSIRFKGLLASILSFSSAQNRLISDANNLLNYIHLNTDDAIVRLQVAVTTWAPANDLQLLRIRTAELAKAVQGWGSCDVSEISGDPYAGYISSLMGVSGESVATASVAPLSDVVYMLPITRPASPWHQGALLFRTPDGKLWPYQPGSAEQTTWIDLIYARPGSGKSVLSNAINLALCLSGGLRRLPRIAIIDIGPSSSGLISLLKEALPINQQHFVTYHRLRMTPDYSINPFDTQLGCRYPTPQERSFLVNFITLLATPLGAEKPYDGIADMAGLVVDELYKNLADGAKPYTYTPNIEPLVDAVLEEIGFVRDSKTTWWEVTDALFLAGFVHEATLAQRYAMPLLADAGAICRSPNVEDLYGKVIAPTGETLVAAFARMISAAVREYPILSRVTKFDLGDARIISLDLDEVAKSGGEAADRQTAVMYMLARYILARNFYLTEEAITEMPEAYRQYQATRIGELREDPKRIVFDEFHRTSKAQAVRDQVIIDMREGRKWKVQIGLISQSVDDFDEVMVEFSTAVYIMDAGPAQTLEKTAKIFGLTPTAKTALRTRVHGPREGGATFLAQFSTKNGLHTQLLTLTLGPIELWAFSTTVEDALVRNSLYRLIGPQEARRVLATLFPNGTVTKVIEKRLNRVREERGLITQMDNSTEVEKLTQEILREYKANPDVQRLPE
ncbi:MAG: icmB [Gammaproteobacteria bacterium]|jgi:intracellular multiplication protein IcmB|nr:icmB [Gammaproteobacteria bacterium]